MPDSAVRPPRHSLAVRVTHWLTVLSFFLLLLSGVEILISHPRFYWGETGNVLTPALFQLPIPSSRALVQTGYGYVLPDQNGWSRSLHFQTAWLIVVVGLLYVVLALRSGHLRSGLLPAPGTLRWPEIRASLGRHLRFARPEPDEAWSYNVLQRVSYLAVIFGLFPLLIWTGLAMSPAFVSAVPATVTLLGGTQSARTIHFFATVALVLFLLVHVIMIWHAGFVSRTRAMVTGRLDPASSPERP